MPNPDVADRERIFRESLIAVFEAMFFESLEADPFQTPQPPPASICAQVEFTGSHDGRMQVALEPGTAATLTGNFLGLPDPVDGVPAPAGELRDSTLGELANICCGSFLSRFVPRGSFSIRPPVLLPAAPASAPEPWLALPMSGGTAYFRLHWKELP
jgi:hypothetical protein